MPIPATSGLITKNPLHDHWRTTWCAAEPYRLGDLFDWLWPHDMRKGTDLGDRTGLGRNCTLFEDMRVVAYKLVVPFKRDGSTYAQFLDQLMAMASGMNHGFAPPLPISEVRCVARSVGKWTWRNFSIERFSRIQAHRGVQGGLRSARVRRDQRDARASAAQNMFAVLRSSASLPIDSGLSDKGPCPRSATRNSTI